MIQNIIHILLHLDQFLIENTQTYGSLVYFLVFAIVFAETGLIIFPFLPGDSLLFALGAICALPDSGINIQTTWAVLFLAVLIGDNLNYQIGFRMGQRLLQQNRQIKFINEKTLLRTQAYFEKYGVMTIIIARFVPLIRTFCPFSAGLGKMKFKKFFTFSIIGSVLWISIFLASGYFVGNSPVVKRNFHFIIIGVILLSLLPILIGLIKSRFATTANDDISNQ